MSSKTFLRLFVCFCLLALLACPLILVPVDWYLAQSKVVGTCRVVLKWKLPESETVWPPERCVEVYSPERYFVKWYGIRPYMGERTQEVPGWLYDDLRSYREECPLVARVGLLWTYDYSIATKGAKRYPVRVEFMRVPNCGWTE